MNFFENIEDPAIEQQEIITPNLNFGNQACGYSFCNQKDITVRNSGKTNTTLSQFQHQQYIELIRTQYESHKIDKVYNLVTQYKKQHRNFGDFLNKTDKQLIQLIQEQYASLMKYQQQLHENSWVFKQLKDGVKISTKQHIDSVGVLTQSQLIIPIEVFITIICQFDLMKDFMPFMQQSNLVRIHSRNQRVGYTVNNFPILSKRQALFQGIGYDRLEHNNTIFLYSTSIHDDPNMLKKFNINFVPKENSIQLNYNYLIVEYTPYNSTNGKLRFALNVDMKLPLPFFILDRAMQSFGYDFIMNVIKVSKKFKGSQWQKKVAENPQFFKFINERQKEFIQNLQNEK